VRDCSALGPPVSRPGTPGMGGFVKSKGNVYRYQRVTFPQGFAGLCLTWEPVLLLPLPDSFPPAWNGAARELLSGAGSFDRWPASLKSPAEAARDRELTRLTLISCCLILRRPQRSQAGVGELTVAGSSHPILWIIPCRFPVSMWHFSPTAAATLER
jgi:hypothetical protein